MNAWIESTPVVKTPAQESNLTHWLAFFSTVCSINCSYTEAEYRQPITNQRVQISFHLDFIDFVQTGYTKILVRKKNWTTSANVSLDHLNRLLAVQGLLADDEDVASDVSAEVLLFRLEGPVKF